MKKVGILLRVSTHMQAKQNDNAVDIPTQRIACMRFIEQHPDWAFEKEYMEIGVSGFKISFSERDKLLEVKEDITARRIDVLVVFMFDRLGRIEEETPFVVKSFVDMGAEVWSVKEGQRRFDAHVDNLLNYLYFWQASGESKKTSERVTNAMTQMAEAGQYTGGKAPYGYMPVETGRLTKKKLPEKTFAILEEEAQVVQLIFDLALTRGYGCHRIAVYLNQHGIKTRTGTQWGHASISNMLNNPIYKGVKAYNRTTGKGQKKSQKRLPPEQWILAQANPAWMIVSESDWEKVRRSRKTIADQQNTLREFNQAISDGRLVKSRLIFAGLAYCGCCGTRMQTGYSPYRWKTEDGIVHRRNNPVYKCGAMASGKTICSGKSSYGREMIEKHIIAAILQYLKTLQAVDLFPEIQRRHKQSTAGEEKVIKDLERAIVTLERGKMALENEVVDVITGKSSFDKDLLNRLIQEKTDTLLKKKAVLQNLVEACEKKKLQNIAPLLSERMMADRCAVFEGAHFDEKKVILSEIIKRIHIHRDKIDVKLRLHIQEFIAQPK